MGSNASTLRKFLAANTSLRSGDQDLIEERYSEGTGESPKLERLPTESKLKLAMLPYGFIRDMLEDYSERRVRERLPKLVELLQGGGEAETQPLHHLAISEDTNHVISFRKISLP